MAARAQPLEMHSMLQQFSMTDNSKLPQKVRLEWSRLVVDDCEQPRPDEAMDGFWPSWDDYSGQDAGDNFEKDHRAAEARMRAWENGAWNFIGVQARVRIMVPVGGNSFACYELTSPGLWSIESDSGEDYLAEIYEEQKAELEAHLRIIGEALTAA
jgi:hypothetical protein